MHSVMGEGDIKQSLSRAAVYFCLIAGVLIFGRCSRARQEAEPQETSWFVRRITSPEELASTLATRDVVLFVDCDWNGEVVAFRQTFGKLVYQSSGDVEFASVKLSDRSDPLWSAVQQLWRQHRIPRGGMKNDGGAGRVVWFRQGEVIDYDWCATIADVEQLADRTQRAFLP